MALDLSYYADTEYRAATVALRLLLGRSGYSLPAGVTRSDAITQGLVASLSQLLDVVQTGRWHAVALGAGGRDACVWCGERGIQRVLVCGSDRRLRGGEVRTANVASGSGAAGQLRHKESFAASHPAESVE